MPRGLRIPLEVLKEDIRLVTLRDILIDEFNARNHARIAIRMVRILQNRDDVPAFLTDHQQLRHGERRALHRINHALGHDVGEVADRRPCRRPKVQHRGRGRDGHRQFFKERRSQLATVRVPGAVLDVFLGYQMLTVDGGSPWHAGGFTVKSLSPRQKTPGYVVGCMRRGE